jgi:hypothetical protein
MKKFLKSCLRGLGYLLRLIIIQLPIEILKGVISVFQGFPRFFGIVILLTGFIYLLSIPAFMNLASQVGALLFIGAIGYGAYKASYKSNKKK